MTERDFHKNNKRPSKKKPIMVLNWQLFQVDDPMLNMEEQRIDLSCIHKKFYYTVPSWQDEN